MLPRIVLPLALLAASAAFAQTTDPTIHTDTDLQQREAKLLETAKTSPTGLAIGRLEDYSNDYTLLIARSRTGEAERHQLFADQMVIRTGTVTLVTGGTMQGEHPNNGPGRPGETLGSGIEGAKKSSSTPETSSTFPPASPAGSKSTTAPPPLTSSSKKSDACPSPERSLSTPKSLKARASPAHSRGVSVTPKQLYLNQWALSRSDRKSLWHQPSDFIQP